MSTKELRPSEMPHQKLLIVIFTAWDTIWYSREKYLRPSQDLAAISDASSGHLRRCSGADTTNKSLSRETDASILSWPTMMGHSKLLIVIFTA
eukprot:scaffold17945_cov136-Skeletonema_dohrnii-CCMP3373.AAC.10